MDILAPMLTELAEQTVRNGFERAALRRQRDKCEVVDEEEVESLEPTVADAVEARAASRTSVKAHTMMRTSRSRRMQRACGVMMVTVAGKRSVRPTCEADQLEFRDFRLDKRMHPPHAMLTVDEV